MKFLRRSSDRYSKLGLRRKKKQIWRKPKGRDNKMREKRRGYPKTVSIGYGKEKNQRGFIQEKAPVIVKNAKDLEKIKKNEIGIIGKIGQKKKIEIAKKAKEKGIQFYNLNVKNFLKESEKKVKKKKEELKTKESEKKKSNKKDKEDKK